MEISWNQYGYHRLLGAQINQFAQIHNNEQKLFMQN